MTDTEEHEFGLYTGEDFELVFTLSRDQIDAARDASPVPVSIVGEVTDHEVTIDGEPLPDRGYTHGRWGTRRRPTAIDPDRPDGRVHFDTRR